MLGIQNLLAATAVLAILQALSLHHVAGAGLLQFYDNLAVALGVGILLTGVEHALAVDRFANLLPAWLPGKVPLVWVSAAVRVVGGFGLMFSPSRMVAAVTVLGLLVTVLPVNLRIAILASSADKALVPWWRAWARVALHAAWITWAASCCLLGSGGSLVAG